MTYNNSLILNIIKETNRFYKTLGPNSKYKLLIEKNNLNNKIKTNSGQKIFNLIKNKNSYLNPLSNENNSTTLIITNSILKELNKNKICKINPEIIGKLQEEIIEIIKKYSIRINIKNEKLIKDLILTEIKKENLNTNQKKKNHPYNFINISKS